jgi:uncharacterized protein with HEPN domain
MSKTDIQRIPDYLDHIQQAIGRIHRYIEGMKAEDFCSDEKTQDAVIRNFEIIGEAARNIKRYHPDFASRHAGVPWESAYEMRNALSHGYSKVDLEIVWRTIQTDLPGLEQRIKELQASF